MSHANTNDSKIVEILNEVIQWHEERVLKLKDLVAIDDDTEIEVVCADGERLVLSGNQRAGFKVGAHAALMMFEKFPLKINAIEIVEVKS